MSSPLAPFLEALSAPWPKETVATILESVRRPGLVDESIKWGNPFLSAHGHAIVKIFVARNWINVYFYRGAEIFDPLKLLGPKGKSAMTKLRVVRGEAVPAGLRELMDSALSREKTTPRNTHVDLLPSARRPT